MSSTQSNDAAVRRASLRERRTCVACGGDRFRVVWRDRFDSPAMARWWSAYGYEADIAAVLAGRTFELVECDTCAMRAQRWVLVDDDLARLYSVWISPAQTRHCETTLAGTDRSGVAFEAARRSVAHLVGLQRLLGRRLDTGSSPHRLVDFGCGDGSFVRLACAFGFDAHGVDSSATRHRQAETDGLRLATDLEDLRRSGVRTVEVVTMFEVLEHLVDPAAALRAVSAMLRPGGVLVVEVPDCSGLDAPASLADFNRLNPIEHVNAFTPTTLLDLCGRMGFVPIRRGPTFVTASPVGAARAVASVVRNRPSTRRWFRWDPACTGVVPG